MLIDAWSFRRYSRSRGTACGATSAAGRTPRRARSRPRRTEFVAKTPADLVDRLLEPPRPAELIVEQGRQIGFATVYEQVGADAD